MKLMFIILFMLLFIVSIYAASCDVMGPRGCATFCKVQNCQGSRCTQGIKGDCYCYRCYR